MLDGVFGEGFTDRVITNLGRRPGLMLLIAWDPNQRAVGAKLGYEETPLRYLSWVGAVAADARRRGLGSALMRAQHVWCELHGYAEVWTRSKNQWREMLILNLKNGFDIAGVMEDEDGGMKVLFRKTLGSASAASKQPENTAG